MGDRCISRKLKRKCAQVVCYPPYMNALEAMINRETTGECPGLRKQNLVRIIVGANRAETRRMDTMKVDVGVKERW